MKNEKELIDPKVSASDIKLFTEAAGYDIVKAQFLSHLYWDYVIAEMHAYYDRDMKVGIKRMLLVVLAAVIMCFGTSPLVKGLGCASWVLAVGLLNFFRTRKYDLNLDRLPVKVWLEEFCGLS